MAAAKFLQDPVRQAALARNNNPHSRALLAEKWQQAKELRRKLASEQQADEAETD